MKIWQSFYSRLLAFSITFTSSTLLVSLFVTSVNRINIQESNLHQPTRIVPSHTEGKPATKTATKNYHSPEFVISLISHSEPIIRQEIFRELFLRPTKNNTYYDYQRDLDYPERADNITLDYVQLDKAQPKAAIIKFIHLGMPSAIVMQKQQEGWIVLDTFSAFGKFWENNYTDWLRTESLIETGVCEILIKEATSDNSSYSSKLVIFKLIDNKLTKVGEILVEQVLPRYTNNKYIPNEKLLSYISYQAIYQPIPCIKLTQEHSIIEYIGEISTHKYWSDIDLCWHTAKQHWHNRPYKTTESISFSQRFLQWDNEKKLFVEK